MVRLIGLILLLLTIPSFAQHLPLELDCTVSLPEEGGLWDVLPMPDGSFIWVQALEFNTDQTRILSGVVGEDEIDTLDLECGSPDNFVAFIREGDLPAVYLASRYIEGEADSLVMQAYTLERGEAIPPQLTEASYNTTYYTYWDWRINMAVPVPPPPEVSSRIISLATSECHHSQYFGFTYNAWYRQPVLYYNASVSDSAFYYSPNGCDFASWSIHGDNVDLATSRYSHTIMNHDESWYDFIEFVPLQPSPDYGARLLSCETIGRIPRECISYPVACTYDSSAGYTRVFARLGNTCGGTDSSYAHWQWWDMRWTTEDLYDFWCAAECIPDNGAEEFLCYSNERGVFDILEAATGHNFGMTDPIAFDSSQARIISRYHAPSRRLATREGELLKLYRFGEYNSIDENASAIPNDFSLSVYPNPFNPSASITFDLRHSMDVQLAVFDISGRKVRTLADERMNAGHHTIDFDGHSLPSGLYFARLQGNDRTCTRKMVLVQ